MATKHSRTNIRKVLLQIKMLADKLRMNSCPAGSHLSVLLSRTAAAHQLLPIARACALRPLPPVRKKPCHAVAGQDFSFAMRNAQALAFYVLIINSLNIYLTVLLK